jgi:hypothetical protein
MHVRWGQRGRGHRLPGTLCVAAMALATVLAAGGCSHQAANSASGPKYCGRGRSPADVPIDVLVDRGQVSCAVALTVERSYSKAVDEGKAPGNGGGGPVPVSGWVCEGFATPHVLKTGQTSKCTKGGTEILATLATT